jgi:hypothetical protein
MRQPLPPPLISPRHSPPYDADISLMAEPLFAAIADTPLITPDIIAATG